MFAAIGRSFRLIKESYHVLRQDPELIWLTVASFIGVAFVVGVLGGFGLSSGVFETATAESGVKGSAIVLLALGYFGGYFTIIYFQVALVAAVLHRMDGHDPDLGYAIGQANRRIKAIVIWTVIAASVGLLLRVLEGAARSQNGASRIIGSIVLSILGFAWSMMVFFVIPVIVVENTSGVEAIKRSSSTLKKKWGEAVIGNQGLGLITFLALFVLAGIPMFVGFAALNASTVLGGAIIAIGLMIGMFVMAAGAALDSTYRAVLYRYATAGELGGFSREVMDSAFRPNKDMRESF